MTNDEIRAIALEVAKELLDEPLNIGQADHYIDFATRFLAAINAKAEPVAWLVRDQVDGLRYPCNQKNPDGSIDGESEPLFTHPAIEPALSAARSLTDELMDCVDRLGSEYDTVDPRVWEHMLVYANPVGAAPLPDDVAQMVEALRRHEWVPVIQQAAEMIERLANRAKNAINEMEIYRDENENLRRLKDAPATPVARQVPPDCVVVPNEYPLQFSAWLKKEMPSGTVIGDPVWWAKKLYKALIAAGEVKP